VSRKSSSAGQIRSCDFFYSCDCFCTCHFFRTCDFLCCCGARTRACRVHTRVNAWPPSRIRARPGIILRRFNQSSFHGIPFNIVRDPAPLRLIPNPMVIGFPLPKLLASSVQQPIGLTRSDSLQRFKQQAGRNRGQQKQVDMIRHDDERPEPILAQFVAAKKRFDYQRGYRVTPHVHRSRLGPVKVAIHPRESFAAGNLAARRKVRTGQTPVELPGGEQPRVVWIDVVEAALGFHRRCSGSAVLKISRSQECERGTHECVRHNQKRNQARGKTFQLD